MSSFMPLRHDFRERPAADIRVVVFGATGYIGRFVVKELVKRGYQVVAFVENAVALADGRAKNKWWRTFLEQRFALAMSQTSTH